MARPQNPVLRAKIEDGKVVWHGIDAKRWQTLMKFLENQDVEITIGKRNKKATPSQRKYYWAVIVAMIAEAAGYTPEEAHEALKWQFLKCHENSAIPTVRSTEDLTTVEREEYHARCRQLAAETYGLYVPDPNEANMPGCA